MEKAIKAKVAKAVVPAIDVMFQALRSAQWFMSKFLYNLFEISELNYCILCFYSATLGLKLSLLKEF